MATHEHMARRAILKGALVAPVLLPAPAWAESVTFDNIAPLSTTPCLDLFHAWHRIDAAFQTIDDGEEGDALFQQLLDVEKRLSDEPATCIEDLAAKVLILTQIRESLGDTPWLPALLEEMEALTGWAQA